MTHRTTTQLANDLQHAWLMSNLEAEDYMLATLSATKPERIVDTSDPQSTIDGTVTPWFALKPGSIVYVFSFDYSTHNWYCRTAHDYEAELGILVA